MGTGTRALRSSLPLLLALNLIPALSAAQPAGESKLQISGSLELKLTPGSHRLPLGRGDAWQVEAGSQASSTTRFRVQAGTVQGKPTLGAAEVTIDTRQIKLTNPAAVASGLGLLGSPSSGFGRFLRGQLDRRLDCDVEQITVSRPAGHEEVRVGARSQLKALGIIEKRVEGSIDVKVSSVRSWAKGSLGPAPDAAARQQVEQLVSLLPGSQRRLIAGRNALCTTAEGSGTAALAAGEHALPLGTASRCSITFAQGSTAAVRFSMSSSTRDGRAQLDSAKATMTFSPAATLNSPADALAVMGGVQQAVRKGVLASIKSAAVKLGNRAVKLSVDEVTASCGAGCDPTVSARGRAVLFGKIKVPFNRTIKVPATAVSGKTDLGCLAGCAKGFEGQLDAEVKAGGSTLSIKARPSLSVEGKTIKVTAPVELGSPDARGELTLEGTHTLP